MQKQFFLKKIIISNWINQYTIRHDTLSGTFFEFFGIANEVVILSQDAALSLKLGKVHGQLFISQAYVAFHAKIFGRVHKVGLSTFEL